VECLYILTKYYGVSRADAAVNLTSLLQYKGIANADKEVVAKSLVLFSDTSLDPVDCILAAWSAVDGNPVMTFDKSLNKHLRE
jgi:predicted nucleic-acid-binding protein